MRSPAELRSATFTPVGRIDMAEPDVVVITSCASADVAIAACG